MLFPAVSTHWPCSVPVSCKAAVSLRCCTPFSSSSSSVLMLVTTSPSKPTSAIPFQKFSVSSVDRQTAQSLVCSVFMWTEIIIIVKLMICVETCALCDLRSHWIPSCPQTPVWLSPSPPSHSESLLCPRPLPRHCPGPPELQFTQENTHYASNMGIPMFETLNTEDESGSERMAADS